MDSQTKIWSILKLLIVAIRENYWITIELFIEGPFLIHGPRAVFLGVPFQDVCPICCIISFLV